MPTSPRPIADIARELGLAAEEWLPGLPRKPNAEGVDITPDGTITGLF
jgi:hypothetical protein